MAALDVSGLSIVAGCGQYFAQIELDRVTVLSVGVSPPVSPPEVLWDGAVPRATRGEALADLRQRAAAFREVELDTMHATPWELAWTIDGGPLVVWDPDGPRLRVHDGTVQLREGAVLALTDIVAVVAQLSADWLTRGVALVVREGAPVVIAQVDEPMVGLDPTYDYICLLCDGRWAVQLASAVAAALEVPVDLRAYD